ncbi:hypothetical protein [Kitasatospora sp. NBC_00458]|uniref:hypothetical protein n=1 Tax=Kitasatospora sp. NBC_00458 TaxID=2903568 RepID=UPI002E1828DA
MTFFQIIVALMRRKSLYGLIVAYVLLALIFAPLAEKSQLLLVIPAVIVAVTFAPLLKSTLKRKSDDGESG